MRMNRTKSVQFVKLQAVARAASDYMAVDGLCPSDLSLINSNNAPGACPQSGRVVRLSRR
jgi:hypothetical protein